MLMADDDDGFSFRAFKSELLQNAGPLLHCHRISCKAATATMMMVNTSPVHIESAAATAEAGVAVLWKVGSQTTKVLMEQANSDYCSESSSNESATCESVAVASSSSVTRCRVDLSATGGDDDKGGRPAVASVVVTVLALILAVVVVPAGVDLLGLDEESNIALWMLFVSMRAATSMSCAFFNGIFRIVLLSKISLNFVQDIGPLARLWFSEILIFFRVGVGIGEVLYCGRLRGVPLGLTKWGKVIFMNGVGFD
ncbi:hypothetical protein QTP88_011163 [Uroleucon formosanum]